MPRTISDMGTIALAVTDGMLHFELAMAYEVFGRDPVRPGRPLVRPRRSAARARCGSAGSGWSPTTGSTGSPRADTVIVPGRGRTSTRTRPPTWSTPCARPTRRARGWSRCARARSCWPPPACWTGCARPRTGRTPRSLAARYPRVEVDPDVLYVDNGSVLTSAGKAAAIDLCLHLIRLDHGSTVANAVARRLVVPPHRAGGQAQFVTTPVPARDDHPARRPVPLGDANGSTSPLTVEDLARQANMSSRNLARHFRSVTGTTPLQWLLDAADPPRPGAAGDHRRQHRRHRRGGRHGHRHDAAPTLQPHRRRTSGRLPPHLPQRLALIRIVITILSAA